MRWVPFSTALVAAAAAAIYAALRVPQALVLVGVAALGMLYAIRRRSDRARVCFEVVLICELILLGTIWPSVWTVAAALVAPALVLALRNLVVQNPSLASKTYVSTAALLAAASLLGQAVHLLGVRG
ncbi:MAG TPA: hypothetical protein VJR89_39245 [Polyangiales bacterium]|nr:hypothetical protein [Polyangiales bacterium]